MNTQKVCFTQTKTNHSILFYRKLGSHLFEIDQFASFLASFHHFPTTTESRVDRRSCIEKTSKSQRFGKQKNNNPENGGTKDSSDAVVALPTNPTSYSAMVSNGENSLMDKVATVASKSPADGNLVLDSRVDAINGISIDSSAPTDEMVFYCRTVEVEDCRFIQ